MMTRDIFGTGQTNILGLCYLFGKTYKQPTVAPLKSLESTQSALAGSGFHMIAELVFTAIAAIIAIVAIIWKPALINLSNHPPFFLNCYLYASQTYRTHSSKLRLLLVFS